MNRWLAFLPLLAGCIIYDHEGKLDDDKGHGEDDPLEGTDGKPTLDDTGEVVETLSFALDPSETYPGETFIAHLTVAEGEFDLSLVASAEFVNGPAIVAMEPAEGELLLTVQVDPLAVPATVDMLLRGQDGRTEFVPQVLTILEVEQGTEPAEDPCE